jgi:hypothetical protein
LDCKQGDAAVFEIFCPNHRSRVLLTTSRIEALRNTPDGPIVDWRCWCGTRGSMANGRAPVRRGHSPTVDAA